MRELKVYNTLTRKKEIFVPVTPGQVKMYVCGITPYNHSHMGNARPFVTWDVIKRYLEHLGYEVTHIQNFTDVDDKIINAANGEGVTWDTISNRYIASYFDVMDKLHIRRADKYPRVSEHMDEIINMVQNLIDKGYAYVIDHNVYYSVEKVRRLRRIERSQPRRHDGRRPYRSRRPQAQSHGLRPLERC